MRIEIPVVVIEFDEGGHTIWVQFQKGATILRIKCTDTLKVLRDCENIVSHADILVPGDIAECEKAIDQHTDKLDKLTVLASCI